MKPELELPCLRTANAADQVALRGVRVRSRLSGMSQRTTVEQTFVNLEHKAIEAVYTFPLPESAAVCGFEVITGDRVLTGQVDEIEQAVERYEQAVSDGHGAFMVEENRPDVFTVRVGNLKPRQAATIRLTYVCPLERADNAIRVAFPTTIAPRYASSAGTDPLGAMIDGDALNPPHVLSVPYGLTLEVEVDLGRPVRRITSPSHSISHHSADAGALRSFVSLAAGVAHMDRDVVLNIELPREHAPVAQAATGPGGASYLAVTFVPEFDVDELAPPEPSETVFVLDCSGSMQGESIQQAMAALELCLRSLSVGDTFNICRFGSTHEMLSPEPLKYSDKTLAAAMLFVMKGADLGGTELYPALAAALTTKPRPGAPRQVILLTDGQVTNEPACVELARKLRGHNRIFSFGIGTACSSSLVKGVARATGGAAEFISPGERIDDKVLRTFARLASPMVSDVMIDWGGCDVQTLADLPPVFDGDVLTVFGRATGKLPRKVTLSCRTQSGPAKWDVPVPNAADDGGVIATMWARRTIQSLEEVNNLHARRYQAGKRSREAETLVSLSKQFGLLSSLTTFLAVEHRSPAERNEGRPALRRVPVMLAKGWGGALLPAAPPMEMPACYASASLPGLPDLASLRGIVCAKASPRRPKWSMVRGASTGDEMDAMPKSPGEMLGDSGERASMAEDPCANELQDAEGVKVPQKVVLALVEGMMAKAVTSGASGVEIEPVGPWLEVRHRVDGRLEEQDRLPRSVLPQFLENFRAMTGLGPRDAGRQEGKFDFDVNGEPISVGVSIIPGAAGELPSVVLHLPGPEADDPAASLRAILALQSAEGWFTWDGAKRPADPVEAAVRRRGHDAAAWWKAARAATHLPPGAATWDRDRVARTGIVLVLLRAAYAGQHRLWRRAEQKAMRYLQESHHADAVGVRAWLTQLEAALPNAAAPAPQAAPPAERVQP